VDRRYQGQGIGELRLMDVLLRARVQSAEIAAAAVVVDAFDAMDVVAAKFYTFPSVTGRLFLPMKAVVSLCPAKQLCRETKQIAGENAFEFADPSAGVDE
jgi:hypothetical protein